jgi:hypothetical protein
MQDLQRIVLRKFSKTYFIKNKNWKQIIFLSIWIILCFMICLLYTFRSTRIRSLERHHYKFLSSFEVHITRFRTFKIRKDKSNCERFTTTWFSTYKNRNSIYNAWNYCKNIFFDCLIHCNISS